jgi:hypothetical protein
MPERTLFATPKDLETAAQAAGKFLISLRQTLGQKEAYLNQLVAVEGYVRMRGIAPVGLEPLRGHAAQGVVFVRFTAEALQEAAQIAGQLAAATWEKMRSGDKSQGWLKWKGGGRVQAETAVLRWYESAVQADPTLALIFELGCRDLFRRVLPRAATGEMASHREALEADYFSEACALIKACRNRLRTKHALDVSVGEKVLDHPAWLSNIALDRLPAKELTFDRFGASTREYNLTPGLIGRLYRVLYGEWASAQEKALFEALGKAIGKPEEILDLISGKVSYLGERTAQEVQKILIKRAKELEAGFTRELEELRAFEARAKKEIQALFARYMEGFRDLPKGLSSENLPALRAQIMDALLELQHAISDQLWHLGDLNRKMKTVESGMGQAKALGKMSLEEVVALLLGEKGKAMLCVEEHLLRFYELREALHGEYAQIWERRSRELAAALREEIGKNQAAVKEARRAQEKGGKGVADGHYLEEMIQTWEAELTVLTELESSKGLSKAYAVEQVVTGYVQFMQNVVEPFVVARALENMVRGSLPPSQEMPPHEKRQALDEEEYIALACEAEGGLFTFGGPADKVCQAPSAEALRHRSELSGLCQRRCGRVVSVLGYSCRGVDYLTTRLGDAVKARQIRNRFTTALAGVARRAGAFLLKETDEGGVFWFGENSRELYERWYKESSGGEGIKLRHSLAVGKETGMAAHAESGRIAVACATEMLLFSEKFIKEHFPLFREWFKETPEWKGLPQGVPYNALPVELKRLFRVGIGLVSGLPGKDLAFGTNALGDADLLGSALSDAVLLSRLQGMDAEQGVRSSILSDENTVLNLLLGLERFTLEEHGKVITAEVVGAKLRRIGYCLFGPSGGGARVLLTEKEETLEVDPLGGLKARGGERTKVLYQIQPIETQAKK